jgi:hypothetical protein
MLRPIGLIAAHWAAGPERLAALEAADHRLETEHFAALAVAPVGLAALVEYSDRSALGHFADRFESGSANSGTAADDAGTDIGTVDGAAVRLEHLLAAWLSLRP